MKHICNNCGAKWDKENVIYVFDLQQRVDPGGIMPIGECPDCGALCYPAKKRSPTKKIYLGIITGEYGSVIFAHQTKKGLTNAIYKFVKKWWEEDKMGALPKKKQEAVDRYFEAAMEDDYLDYCDQITVEP